MLSDAQIKDAMRWRGLEISDYDERCLQAASYDVHLHPCVLILRDGDPLDPKADTTGEWELVEMSGEGAILGAGEFVLGSTLERFSMGPTLAGQLNGKSSLGRLGLIVHSTAGFLDPGFTGQITLELGCVQSRGIVLYPGMPIGQVGFFRCSAVSNLYVGKYSSQHGPTPSRSHENWDEVSRSWVG